MIQSFHQNSELRLFDAWKKVPNISSQTVVKDGDEPHRTIHGVKITKKKTNPSGLGWPTGTAGSIYSHEELGHDSQLVDRVWVGLSIPESGV